MLSPRLWLGSGQLRSEAVRITGIYASVARETYTRWRWQVGGVTHGHADRPTSARIAAIEFILARNDCLEALTTLASGASQATAVARPAGLDARQSSCSAAGQPPFRGHSAAVEIAATASKPVAWVVLTAAEVEAARDHSPAGIALRALKDDNILRSWLQRQRKDLLRRLARLDIEGGIAFEDLCGTFEGRHILMDQLVRQYLQASGQEGAEFLDCEALTAFVAYVREFSGDRGLERFPLRAGFRLLAPAERAALAAQGSDIR